MKFYIATALENAATARRISEALIAAGHRQTYDWTSHGSVQEEGEGRISEVSKLERKGVLAADMVIIILPGGRGTHTELGLALADAEKEVIICGRTEHDFMQSGRVCSFYFYPGIERIVGNPEAWLKGILLNARCMEPINGSRPASYAR